MLAMEEGRDNELNTNQGLLAFMYADVLKGFEGQEMVRLSYKEERLMIQDKIWESGRKIKFWSAPATVENLKYRLDYGCKILHFTGHGHADYLAFEKTGCCGATEPLTAKALHDQFKDRGDKPDLVFIGSCNSEECGRAVADAGVPHVVAVEAEKEVPDKAAQKFCTVFYHALIAGNRTIQQAFEAASSRVAIEEPTAAGIFLLLPKSMDHNVRIFDGLPRGMFEDETPSLPPIFRLPAPRLTYQGGVELQRVLKLLEDTNTACVTITGKPGIGKTERALQACYYLRERNLVCSIFFAHCRDIVAQHGTLPSLGGRCARVERLCQLIGLALDMSPPASTPSDLWEFMRKSTTKEIKQRPIKILLVVDAADAFCERGGEDARASLSTFINELCNTDVKLKILVTSDEGILERTDQYPSNSREEVHPVKNLEMGELAKLLLSLFPCDGLRSVENKMGLKKCESYEDVVNALGNHKLLKSVEGNPGVLCQIAPQLRRKQFSDDTVEETAMKYFNRMQYMSKNKSWDATRSHQISVEGGLNDNRCRDIWLQATFWAASDCRSFGEEDGACYRFVGWSDLSVALERTLYQVQTTSSGVGRSMSSEDRLKGEGSSWSSGSLNSSDWGVRGQSQGYGFDSCFQARSLEDSELNFIREVLRKYSSNDKKRVDNSERETGEDDQISLETFARFSEGWLGPVMATLSLMRQDWAEIPPIKVHGFVSRKETKRQLLETGLLGVFLLRFSETHVGRFMLSITCEMPPSNKSRSSLIVKEFLVTAKEDGKWTSHYDANVSNGITYESLSKLVLEKPSLRKLYPGTPKETVFGSSPSTDSNASILVNDY
ncbi:unnamed protein product [Ascophyllum nodosum]